ncbi:lysoplasmalogenase [Rudanella paleaurantiibacter]|uniref:Lysoplasmalogenase n=1 Tax=Rudanella paleaurantiibacter TaxID=2614655 RepID=A0A7J5U148_9BACT|nr:lysoplasmalogenase [Rudanella paleaurantiibacter]KAB7730320.1 lysoplasmalogenase [Rudanella paleaurantiibacter]
MVSRPLFIWLFLVTALEITGNLLHIPVLHYVCKPLIMLSLMTWVVFKRAHWQESGPVRWLFVGMVFALLGDVFLMIREIDLFVVGLGSFLLMQLAYIAAFWGQLSEVGVRLSAGRFALRAIPFGLYSAGFLLYLYKPLETTGLLGPVVGYIVCIALMGIMAAMRREAVTEANHKQVVAGAVLFMVSDSAIALNKFAFPLPAAHLIVMSTYAVAQYLIVTGVVEATIDVEDAKVAVQ